MRSGLCCVALAFVVSAVLRVGSSEEGGEITSALLEVKNFINNHLPEYPGVGIEYIGGKDPEMVFKNKSGEEVERVVVADMDEDGINQLLNSHGFFKKEAESEGEDDEDSSREEL